MQKLKYIVISFLLVSSTMIQAKNLKIEQHIQVKNNHFLVSKDNSIYEIFSIESRDKNLNEWFTCEPVPSFDEKFQTNLKDFEFPEFINISKKTNQFDEILDLLSEKSKQNIEKATHIIHIKKDSEEKWLLAKSFDLKSVLHFFDKTRNSDSEKIYQDAYNYGFNKGSETGHKKGLVIGKKDGYKSGYDKASNEGKALLANKYKEGINSGYAKGSNEGKALAQKKYQEGYNAGVNQAKKEASITAKKQYDDGYKIGFSKGLAETVKTETK